MNTLLWICQVVLASVFFVAGSMKLLLSREQLSEKMGDWPDDFAPRFLKFIGAAEVLGAGGIIIPWLTRIAPILTPVAAAGLAAIMVGAIATHAKRGEIPNAFMNVAVIAMAVFVGFGRW